MVIVPHLLGIAFLLTAATASNTSFVPPNVLEVSTGLLSSLILQTDGVTTNVTDPQAFNSSTGELKLGPALISEELRAEAEYVYRTQAIGEQDPMAPFEVFNS